MEPAAPGTEDEVNLPLVPAVSKKQTEEERLLSLKGVLANGSYGNIFELAYVNGNERWYCNICQCPVMGRAYNHEIGKRHSFNLNNSNKKLANMETRPEPEAASIHIAPGEPVPPGFEGEVVKLAQIQERLNGYNVGPLVALEYLLELQDFDISKEPTYLCILCDKKGDPRTVLTHLSSYNHLSQYLQKHFPTSYRALAPYMTKQYKRNWHTTLQKIAEAIESRFGRLKPFPVELDSFNKNRLVYLERIAKGKHFYESPNCTFEELIDKDELTKLNDEEALVIKEETAGSSNLNKKRSPSPPVVARPTKKKNTNVANKRKSLSPVSSISSDSDLSDKNFNKNYQRDRPYYKRSRSPYKRSYHYRSPSPRRDSRRDAALPWQRPNYGRKSSPDRLKQLKNDKNEKLEEYKKLARAIENDTQRTWKQHEKNPEKHPQYNEEWKKFWNRRYKELQIEGKDPTKYDFKPEWIVYWNKRMGEIRDEELKSKKEALRKRLGIEEPAPISFKIGASIKTKSPSLSKNDNKPIPPSACPDSDPEVVIIDDNSRSPGSSTNKSHARKSRKSEELFNKKSKNAGVNLKGAVDISPGALSLDGISSTGSSSPEDFDDEKYSSRPRSKEDFYVKRSRSRSRDRRSYEVRSRSRSRDRYSQKHPKEFRGRERIRTVAELPWERERMRGYPEYKPPRVMRDVTREPVLDNKDDDNEEVNVVSVLRLLTALEEKLGSLGPKVIDLLGKALALEKNEANSSEKLLDNDVNCVLFETVKEKLKGQLLVGLVDYIQEKAFKNAIKKTASLIHFASTRKLEQDKLKPKDNPLKVPGVGTVDKAAIAKQIATALVMQGKTDVTQAELEQLINAVVGMAEAAKNSGKPMTTANFLQQLTGQSSGNATEDSKPEGKKIEESLKSNESSLKSEKSNITATTNMDHLSDSDLQTLLQNFKDLSTDEQHGLINYLKTLEAREPERVERLRKFVNLGTNKVEDRQKAVVVIEEKQNRSESPFSNRLTGANPDVTDNNKEVINLIDDSKPKFEEKKTVTSVVPPENKNIDRVDMESDEEDYTFDDVVKAVSKNVEEKEQEKKRQVAEDKIKQDSLVNTQTIISNLLNTFKNSAKQQNEAQTSSLPPVSTAEFTKTLNSLPVNVANLANIVGNVKNLQSQNQQSIIEKDAFDIESVSTVISPHSFHSLQNIPKFDMFDDNFKNNQNSQLHFERPAGLDGNDPRNNLNFDNRQMRPDFDNFRSNSGPSSFDRFGGPSGSFDRDGPRRDFGGQGMRQGRSNFDGVNARGGHHFGGKNNLQNPYSPQNVQYPSQRGGPYGRDPRFSDNREQFYEGFSGNKPPFNSNNMRGGYNNRW